jgi:hypothetical protein
MKWKTPKSYKEDEIRERVIFALWPRYCDDGYTHWLEKIIIKEGYYWDRIMGSCWISLSVKPYEK